MCPNRQSQSTIQIEAILVNGSVELRRSEIDGYVYVAISLREMNPDFVAPNWFRWDRN